MSRKEKLSAKELIQAGGFGAIYLVVYFTLAMLLGFNPITFFVTGPIAAVVLGTVYMLYVAKVPKRGAIFILSIFNGFLLSTNFVYAFFKEEINAIKQAMSYRGLYINLKSVICHPVLMIEHVLVPLLISSANVMDELAAASMCRGLDTDVHRTSIYTVKFRLLDFSFIALLFIVLILAKGGWL